MIHFSQDDSVIRSTPQDLYSGQSFSPARKKNRLQIHQRAEYAFDSSNPGISLLSQDSAISFSQDFAERIGGLNVQCSQDCGEDSNVSCNEKIPMPAPRPVTKSIRKQKVGDLSAAEEERQIDLRLVNANPFLSTLTHHTEQYFSRASLHTGMKLPPKIWITAFKERPRYITDFEEVAHLGEGNFSSVFCARHRLDGNLYAIKRSKMRVQSENHARMMTREVCAFTALTGCPNLVRYFSSWLEENQLYMQLELCPLGSLEDLISKNPSRCSIIRTSTVGFEAAHSERQRSDSCVSEAENASIRSLSAIPSPAERAVPTQGIREDLAWLLLHDIACCLQFMHSKNMAHLDIRPANIFMQASPHFLEPINPATRQSFTLFQTVIGGNTSLSRESSLGSPMKGEESIRDKVEKRLVERNYVVKVGDLGHCRALTEKALIEEGESRYCPRELINSDGDALDFTKSDIFSLGASVYELCLGRFLGASGDDGIAEWHSVRDGELSVDFDFHYSTTLTDFIRKLLHPEPKLRPSALETIVIAGGQFDSLCNSKVKSPSESMNVNNAQVAALMAENERLRALLSSMVPPKA
eukprot:gene6109-6726_t